jgi:hypothetical protein
MAIVFLISPPRHPIDFMGEKNRPYAAHSSFSLHCFKGRVTIKVDPFPGTLLAVIVPL